MEGDHPRIEAWRAGVEVLGTGPRTTRLAGPLVLDEPDAVLGGLTVRGALQIQATATITDTQIEAAPTPAIHVQAPATLDRVVVLRPTGDGAAVQVDAALTWTGGGLEETPGVGLSAFDADTQLSDLDLSGIGNIGILLENGRHQLSGIRIRGAAGAGIRSLRAETEVMDCGITGVGVAQNIGSGIGVVGGSLRVHTCEIIDCERGLRAALEGQLIAEDVQIESMSGDGVSIVGAQGELRTINVQGAGNGGLIVINAELTGAGLELATVGRAGLLMDDATATIDGLTVRDSEARGVSALRTRVDLANVHVADAADVCMQVTDCPTARIDDATLERCGNTGLSLFSVQQPAELNAVTITETRVGTEGDVFGLQVVDAIARITDLVVRDGPGEGVRFESASGEIIGAEIHDHAAPGIVVLDPPAELRIENLIARNNGGTGVLAVGGPVRIVNADISESRDVPAIGGGDGIAAPFQTELRVSGGRMHANAGNGISVEGLSTVWLQDDVQLDSNDGWGLLVNCGARIESPADFTSRDNNRGNQSICQ
jgi:hypothetical protein